MKSLNISPYKFSHKTLEFSYLHTLINAITLKNQIPYDYSEKYHVLLLLRRFNRVRLCGTP